MRIATKATLIVAATGLALFGAYGIYLVATERSDLRRAVDREMRLLGRSLQVAVENALRDRQLEDIQETVEKLEEIDPGVQILVYDAKGRLSAASYGAVVRDLQRDHALAGAIGDRETILRFEEGGDHGRLLLAVPLLDDDGTLLGGMVVIRPLVDVEEDLAATRRGIGAAIVLFVLFVAVLGLGLGRFYLARPLGTMAEAMRHVREGDLTSGIDVRRKDEIGDLAREFNAMVAELGRARSQLEDEAEARRRLQAVLQEADKMIAIGQLSAGLAHEIGSPLQILGGRARSLLKDGDSDPAQTRRVVEIIVEQTDRIADIVEQLLRFARRRPVRMTEVELGAAVTGVLDLLAFEARRRGIELVCDIGDDLPRVQADPDQMQQVILNLVSNALAATGDSGRVTVRLAPGTMRARDGTREVPCVRLTVGDTGIGIQEEDLPHLFEAFFTTRAGEGGTGLGLAVVSAIVTEHGGTISVDSTPGEGTEFTVSLPLGEVAPS